MNPRELTIGLSLLIPTLAIGFWPRVAIDLYSATTDVIARKLLGESLVAVNNYILVG